MKRAFKSTNINTIDASIMMRRAVVLTLLMALFAVAVPLALISLAQDREAKMSNGQRPESAAELSADDYRLSGPYTHQNLSIFLIHGKDQVEGKNFLTLQEALEQKKVVVYETQDVNELAIENRSTDEVFVQAGEIVKGGQQDRVLAVDLVVAPKSGKIPIAAFCVEKGRWSRRGAENVGQFSSSADAINTKDLKIAAKRSKSQGAVWDKVKVAQEKLSENVGTPVNSSVSSSSLQLALENDTVKEHADAYIRALSGVIEGKSDVIGYAFAINGKLNSADVYLSNQLFQKLWPKLLKASSQEAIAELQKDAKFDAVDKESVGQFLVEAEAAAGEEKEVPGRVKLMTREDNRNILFETSAVSAPSAPSAPAKKGPWIHRNYIRK